MAEESTQYQILLGSFLVVTVWARCFSEVVKWRESSESAGRWHIDGCQKECYQLSKFLDPAR